MSREYKKRRKRSRKYQQSVIENLQKAHDQQRNPLGERTNTLTWQSPTKVINRLKKENQDLQKKAEESTRRYWNARRQTLRLEKAATAWKIDLKQVKANATRLCGVADMLGKELQDLKETANETTSFLQARINIFLGEAGMTHHLQARIKALL